MSEQYRSARLLNYISGPRNVDNKQEVLKRIRKIIDPHVQSPHLASIQINENDCAHGAFKQRDRNPHQLSHDELMEKRSRQTLGTIRSVLKDMDPSTHINRYERLNPFRAADLPMAEEQQHLKSQSQTALSSYLSQEKYTGENTMGRDALLFIAHMASTLAKKQQIEGKPLTNTEVLYGFAGSVALAQSILVPKHLTVKLEVPSLPTPLQVSSHDEEEALAQYQRMSLEVKMNEKNNKTKRRFIRKLVLTYGAQIFGLYGLRKQINALIHEKLEAYFKK